MRIGERERAVHRALAVPDHEQAEDEDTDDDRGHAVQDVEHDAQASRHLSVSAYSAM